MTEPYVIVYITSLSHSGSTLLDLLLSSHSQVAGMGEIKVLSEHVTARLDKKRPHRRALIDKRCPCGVKRIGDCTFWQAVDERVRRDLGLPFTELDLYSEDEATFLAHNLAILRAVHAVAGSRFIVDLSKDLKRLRRLAETGVFDIRVVHLVRHPLGVVCSQVDSSRKKWSKEQLEGRAKVATGRFDRNRLLATHAMEYTRVLLKTRQYLRHRPHLEVSYEALASSPEREVRRVMEWLGLDFEPGQLDWAGKIHHHIHGNRMRRSRSSEIRLDRRWESELGTWQKLLIRALTLPVTVVGGGATL